jgi:valyl-tRNA synthetase
MPHITEEIWHTLTQRSETEFLALQAYPDVISEWLDPDLERTFELLTNTIRIIRNLRAEAQVKPALKVDCILQSENPQERDILSLGSRYLQDLAKVEDIAIVADGGEIPQQSLVGVTGTVQIALPLAGVVDLESFKAKLQKELGKLEKEIQGFEKRLNNPGFVNKAPAELIENTKGLLAEAQKQAEIISDRLQRL